MNFLLVSHVNKNRSKKKELSSILNASKFRKPQVLVFNSFSLFLSYFSPAFPSFTPFFIARQKLRHLPSWITTSATEEIRARFCNLFMFKKPFLPILVLSTPREELYEKKKNYHKLRCYINISHECRNCSYEKQIREGFLLASGDFRHFVAPLHFINPLYGGPKVDFPK